jgi:hypothetical protein
MTATAKIGEVKPATAPAEKRQRAVSAIGYTYFDHNASIKVAEIVLNVGGGNCAPDFLASKLGYKSVRSGTFLTRVASARMFGYVTMSAGNFTITDRARAILSPVMPEDSVLAKIDGFLAVPLFSRVYEDFKGRQLPHEVGLRNLFLNTYKIVPDRVQDAVRVFNNSAEQCGFFHAGRDRLIKPSVNAAQSSQITTSPSGESASTNGQSDGGEQQERHQRGGGRGGGGGGDGSGIGGGVHTAIAGLLRELPAPGTAWDPEDKQTFLDAMKAVLDFIYPKPKTAKG